MFVDNVCYIYFSPTWIVIEKYNSIFFNLILTCKTLAKIYVYSQKVRFDIYSKNKNEEKM